MGNEEWEMGKGGLGMENEEWKMEKEWGIF